MSTIIETVFHVPWEQKSTGDSDQAYKKQKELYVVLVNSNLCPNV